MAPNSGKKINESSLGIYLQVVLEIQIQPPGEP